jgi:hypothetical protein
MYYPVSHRNDLPPRRIPIASSQFNGQRSDGLADHCQMMQNGCRQNIIVEEEILRGRGNNRLNCTARRKNIF